MTMQLPGRKKTYIKKLIYKIKKKGWKKVCVEDAAAGQKK